MVILKSLLKYSIRNLQQLSKNLTIRKFRKKELKGLCCKLAAASRSRVKARNNFQIKKLEKVRYTLKKVLEGSRVERNAPHNSLEMTKYYVLCMVVFLQTS